MVRCSRRHGLALDRAPDAHSAGIAAGVASGACGTGRGGGPGRGRAVRASSGMAITRLMAVKVYARWLAALTVVVVVSNHADESGQRMPTQMGRC